MRRELFVVVVSVLAAATTAFAAGPPVAKPLLAQQAADYIKANKLPQKVVKVRLDGRRVDRIFVPVTPKTADDFIARFNQAKGSLVLRRTQDQNHPNLIFNKTKAARFYSEFPVKDTERCIQREAPGWYLTFALDKPQMTALGKFLTSYNPSGGSQKWQKAHKNQQPKGGCMWWLMHAETGKNKFLAHELGVTRSAAPSNLVAKLLHAGNERVGVVGVAVKDVAEFKKLTRAKLLGAPPPGGAADAVK